MTTFSPVAVANTFISRHGNVDGIQHLKLQKLVYYTHGWWLAYHPEPMLSEDPEVWKFGPVFDSIYRTFKSFGSTPIIEPQSPNPFGPPPEILDDETDPEIAEMVNLIGWVWNKYKVYSPGVLSEMTHQLGTPWRKIAEERKFKVPQHLKIPAPMIKEYFEGLRVTGA